MSCADFIADSFAVRTAAHLLHLASTSYAEHVALGEFYEELTDLVDKYAEVYQGAQGRIARYPSIAPPKDPPVELLEKYLVEVKEEQEEDKRGQALLNILAEIEELTCRTLYKLKFLS